MIRSSLACLASRFSHCSKVVGLEVFATRRTQILHQIWEQRTIFQAHLSWFPLFLHGRSVVANASSSDSDVEPAISRIPTLPVRLFRAPADPRDGPSVGGRQLPRGPQQVVRRNHEFHPAGLRALQRWSSRTSGGTPRAGHADPGDEPHGGSGSLAADWGCGGFEEIAPWTSLWQFGHVWSVEPSLCVLSFGRFPQGLQTLGRSWSPIHRPSDVSPFHPGQSDNSGMVQFLILREVDVSLVWVEHCANCALRMLDVPVVSPILFQLCIALQAARHRTNWQSISNRFRPVKWRPAKLIAFAPGQTVMTPWDLKLPIFCGFQRLLVCAAGEMRRLWLTIWSSMTRTTRAPCPLKKFKQRSEARWDQKCQDFMGFPSDVFRDVSDDGILRERMNDARLIGWCPGALDFIHGWHIWH